MAPPVEITCEVCGKRFKVAPSKAHRRKYCSRACLAKAKFKYALQKETLRRLYVEEHLSLREIARRMGGSIRSLYDALRRYGIKRDFRGRKEIHAFPEPSKVNVEWLVGFIDGEGWFTLSLNRKNKTMSPAFGIGQKDKWILEEIRKLLGFGRISKNGKFYHFRISGIEPCKLLIRILERFPPILKKDKYETWKKIVYLMDKGAHLSASGRKQIELLRKQLCEKSKNGITW